MKHVITDQVKEILTCPMCQGKLTITDLAISCGECSQSYPILDNGQYDLRLQGEKTEAVEFALGVEMAPEDEFDLTVLPPHPDPPLNVASEAVLKRLPKILMGHFPPASEEGNLMLDLGSGDGLHKEVVEKIGYEWVGLDFDNPLAPIGGDAHALPFAEESFEFILSLQTFEHLKFPFVAAKEAQRALKPGGTLIATVSFIEPYHQYSYFHHTHLGVETLLKTAGLKPEYISPYPKSGLQALGEMSLFRPLPEPLVALLLLPVTIPHRLWWKLGYALTKNPRASETYRKFSTYNSFMFIAKK
ncbi:methyltransferase domain-containing protein [Chloroflexota bacterium]